MSAVSTRSAAEPLARIAVPAGTTGADAVAAAALPANGPNAIVVVRDAEGRRLFRMRGNFYPDGSLERIAAALPVPVEVTPEPISVAEFFRTYPGSAYWFEHRPILRVAVFAFALVAALAIAAWVMTILGMPVGF